VQNQQKKAMKKIYIFLVLLIASKYGQSTIITVNNEVGAVTDYTDIASAIAVAVNGDTLYIQPSATNYGSFSLSKSLVLMGAGHNPSFSPYNSQITTITLISGSSNSIFKGLNISAVANNNSVINNILFSGCRIYSSAGNPFQFQTGTMNNWIFEGCVIENVSAGALDFSYMGSNLIFRNNYIFAAGASFVLTSLPSGTFVDHNVIVNIDNNVFWGPVSGTNVTVTNNVVITQAPNNYGLATYCGSCTFTNNILYPQNGGGQFPAAPSNLVNVNPVFNSMSQVYGYSYNYNLDLDTSSAGNNAGTDGTDIGLYGGIGVFSPIGVDNGSPHINTFTLGSSSAPQGGTITIHLNASGSGQ
jgi:hypothetical protein